MGRPRPRMDFEQLLSLQDILDIQLINGELTWLQYEREFMSLLRATGYSLRDYEEGIDRRWDYIAALRCIAPRGLA